eukprot:scaffold2090_cov225-Prasinococcus_capsulatus_cf.AAC.49
MESIQQAATIAVGRLASHSADLAGAVVTHNVLPQLVAALEEPGRYQVRAAAFALRAVAKHTPELARSAVNAGAVPPLVRCMEQLDPGATRVRIRIRFAPPRARSAGWGASFRDECHGQAERRCVHTRPTSGVKESAAWALGYIARHSADLARQVVEAGALPLLVLCVQEPELSLKRIAASALADVAKHSLHLAQAVVGAGACAGCWRATGPGPPLDLSVRLWSLSYAAARRVAACGLNRRYGSCGTAPRAP